MKVCLQLIIDDNCMVCLICIVRVKSNRPSARRLVSGGSAGSDTRSDTQSFSDSGKSDNSGGNGLDPKFASDTVSNGLSD